MKIYFFTRSFYPYQKTGGAQIRNAQVDTLERLGYDVVVVMPDYENSKVYITDKEIKIPFLDNHRFVTLLEMFGVYEDYLDRWVKSAYKILKIIVKKDDILFATSGGELGMIKLAILLKRKIACKVMANFHDPLVYSKVHGYRLKHHFHVSRERVEMRYLKEVDFIITSSKSYKLSLIEKYHFLREKIAHIYFGYIKEIQHTRKKERKEFLNIVYAGYMSVTQQPEMMLELLGYSDSIRLFFVGDRSSYSPLRDIEDSRVEFIDYLPHDKFLNFMQRDMDIGFVSLSQNYFGACVPSKIYEYINLNLPMFGMLPKGDAQDIINNNCYGIAIDFDKTYLTESALKELIDRANMKKYRQNIIIDRPKWSFENRFEKVDKYIKLLMDKK